MRILLLAPVLAAACSKAAPPEAAATGAASGEAPSAATEARPKRPQAPTITIDELAARLERGDCRAVDANADATRKRMGVIPGAVLLTEYDTYLPSELPRDKQLGLVFYCANTHCGASEEAASRAIIAGHTDVHVLPDGIAGWVKAGKQTAKL